MEIQDGMPRPGKMFLSIVVPCYNEEEGLREFHRQMTAAARALCGQRFELILIDDGSTDNTWKLINELSAEDRNVVAVRLAAQPRSSIGRDRGAEQPDPGRQHPDHRCRFAGPAGTAPPA